MVRRPPQRSGITKVAAIRYSLAFPALTTLKRIEDHRLRALVLEDLGRYPWSAFGEIHARIGTEIPPRRLRTMLTLLVHEGGLQKRGVLKGTRYADPGAPLLTNAAHNPRRPGQ